MSEKLIIKNFGPIKHAELELKRFTLLIGEQATGKSTVAKALAACRYFSYIIKVNDFITEDPIENHFSDGLSAWGLKEFIKSNSFIFYQCEDYETTIQGKIVEVPTIDFDKDEESILQYISLDVNTVSKSDRFDALLLELKKLKSSHNSYSDWYAPTSFYQNEVSKIMRNPFYLPAERGLQSIFSLGKRSIQNISDSLFNQFARLDQITRLFRSDTNIEPLGIIYKNVDGKGFVKKTDEEDFHSLYTAATGYQSTIPVVLVLKYYRDFKNKNKTFIIEEPELNLFPAAQRKLVEYLAEASTSFGDSFLLTTHSPYILSSLNNLLYAYKVGQVHEEAVSEIISKKSWLNPAEFSAYKLLSNGTAKNIVDAELEEIMVEELDGAGKEINAVYDKLLDIKFRNNEKSGRLPQLH